MSRNGSGESVGRSFLSIVAIAKGTGLAFIVVLFSALLLGLAVSLTEWEGFTRGLNGFTYVSIALGAMLAAKQSRRLGWLHGALVGFVYHIVSSLFFQSDFTLAHMSETAWLMAGVWSLVAGAVGGVFGVNS